jgi:hypothetical protein
VFGIITVGVSAYKEIKKNGEFVLPGFGKSGGILMLSKRFA